MTLKDLKDQLLIDELCIVGRWQATLSDEDFDLAEDLIFESSASAERLTNEFRKLGAPFKVTALKTHRRRGCKCSQNLRQK